MKLFDSHCHLDDKSYQRDIDKVVLRARRSGVERIMCAGVTLKTSRKAVDLTEKYEGVFAAVGVHPHDVSRCTDGAMEELIELSRHPGVFAWGEIGLDFNRMYSPRDDQEKWFVRQLEAAAELDLPIIFHERDSQGRFLEILKAHTDPDRRGVVHCFSGTAEELEQYLKMGFLIGITGIVTMPERGRKLRQMVAGMPADRLLIETDAPYLTPLPDKKNHRRNEPAFVKSVMLKLAEVRQQDPQRLSRQIWQNTCRLYGLEV